MISVIISSASKACLEQVKANIESTIGLPYELLAFDNAGAKMGICEVYNLGAVKARYDILCFMHEDLEIETLNWGQEVISTFESNVNLGVLGLAGSAYKTYAPSGWDVEGNQANTVRYINYVQAYKRVDKPAELIYVNPTGASLAKVACVDGMWLCTRKQIALAKPFDQELLKGFHGYDVDFCLNVGQEYEVMVTFKILMKHFSEGNFNEQWLLELLNVQDKWKSILPVKAQELSDDVALQFETKAYRSLVGRMIQFKFKKGFIFKQLLQYKRASRMSNILMLKLSFKLLKDAIGGKKARH